MYINYFKQISRFLLGLMICCLLFSKSVSAQEYKFKFNPPDNLNFVQNIKNTKTTKVENLGERVDVTQTRLRVNIKKIPTGFKITMTPLSTSIRQDDQIISNPIIDLLKDIVVTYEVDNDGKLLKIKGYENVLEKAKKSLPPSAIASVTAILSEEALVNKEKTEWSGRIEDFANATVKIGDAFTVNLPFALPNGETINYYTVIKVTGKDSCAPEKTCLKIETLYNSNAEALAKFAGKTIEQITNESSSKPTVSKAEIQGKAHRLIDPETMLIYEETINRTIKFQLEIPGQGKKNVVSEEKRVYTYEYTPE